jgi:hypothetical protein
MTQGLKWIVVFVAVFGFNFQNSYCLVGPVRVLPSGNVLLVPNDEIKLSEQHFELYHHPLGIWLVEYRALLKNLRSYEITLPVGFPAGFDVRQIENELYCDRFDNFKVYENDRSFTEVNYMIQCSNYVETTGTQWGVEDGTGIGFVNTWQLSFKPDEAKWLKVTFSLVVKKIPFMYNPDMSEPWYLDLVNWVKHDYSTRAENSFQLPLSIGSFWAFYPDSVLIRTYIADNWLKIIGKSERKYDKELIQRHEFSEPIGFFSPQELNSDTLSVDQMQNMTPTELILLKNTFLAKYGKKFENRLLKKYFEAQPWYSENPGFHNWYLTEWDVENVKRINEYEKRIKQNDQRTQNQ